MAGCERLVGLVGDYRVKAAPGADAGSCVKACGQVTELVSDDQDLVVAMAIDSESLYFVTRGNTSSKGALKKVPLDGGRVTTLAVGDDANDLALDATAAYLTAGTATGSVAKIPLDGASLETIASAQPNPGRIVIDQQNAYWVQNGGSVAKAKLAGGPTETLVNQVSGSISDIATDGVRLYLAEQIGADTGLISSLPVDGSEVPTSHVGAFRPDELGLSGPYLYWSSTRDNSLWGCETSACNPLILITDPSGLGAIAADATHVYWVSGITLKKMPRDGGKVIALASAQSQAANLLVDATSVYWSVGGAVREMPLGGVICEEQPCQ